MDKLDHLKSEYAGGKLTRRRFMEGAIALGMTVATASAFVDQAHAAEPKRGGTFRLGLAGASTTDVLDPAKFISTFTQIGLTYGAYNNLTEVAPDGSLVPELAESYEASPDAKTWVFRLRRDVEFHNGKTLEAQDVITSINHHRDEEVGSGIRPLFESVEDIRADDKLTVVITLAEGNADFPYIMNDYHLPILPDKDGKLDWQSTVGTGGYTVEEFDAGVRVHLKRFPNYWKEGRAHFDEAVLLGIPDPAARQNALVSGEIDAMNHVVLQTAHLLERDQSVVINEVTGTQHYTMPMNTTLAPFGDNNVRMALKHAIDRQALVDTILYGRGRVGNDHPIAPANRYFAADLEQRAYDPEKARWYLRQAGLSNLSVALHTANTAFAGAVDAAVLYAEHARQAGIEIEVVREPDDGFWTNVWMNKPWTTSYWGGRPTEDWMFTVGYAAGSDWNETFWSNDRFMKLLVQARAELDDGLRREMYHEMQSIVRDDGGAVVPMYANYVDARSVKVAHEAQLSPAWELDGWKCVERWWFA